jgi:hypothetical protein
MKAKVERHPDGKLESVCGPDIGVRIERYPDSRFKSACVSSEQYESWIDEEGVLRSVRKDPRFDWLLMEF